MPTVVQTVVRNFASAENIPLAIGSTTAGNSLLAIVTRLTGAGNIDGVQTDGAVSLVRDASSANGVNREFFRLHNIAAGITQLNFTNTSAGIGVFVQEVSGLADAAPPNALNTNTANSNTASVVMPSAGDEAFHFGTISGPTVDWTGQEGTTVVNPSTGQNRGVLAYKIASGETTLQAGTATSNVWVFDAVSYSAVAASGHTLTSATATSITQTTATIGCTSDSAEGLVHAGVTTTATPPSDAQLIAGSGGGIVAAGSVSAAAGANTVGLTGLTANTGYFRHFIQSDGAGTATSTMLSPDDPAAGFTTLEAAIELSAGTVVNSTIEGFQLRFTTTVGNGIAYYVVFSTAVALHTDNAAGRQQVRDGLDSAGNAALRTGSMAVNATGQHTFPAVTGLTSGSYHYAIVQEGTP